jgi:hypothetical protein
MLDVMDFSKMDCNINNLDKRRYGESAGCELRVGGWMERLRGT